jgi:hypothetical protein
LGREPKVGDQVERFTNTHFAVPRLGLSKILFSLLRNLRNVGSIISEDFTPQPTWGGRVNRRNLCLREGSKII